ncbi:unnamed protein product [Ectocarpus sp. 13 AM-2016]
MIILTVAWSIAVFVLAGLCEIGGGWLVWQAVREKRPSRWWIVPGVLLLTAYGFVTPGLLPDVSSAEFGRAFAVYGGIFIAMSLGWGAVFDGFRADAGDYAGACVVLAGVAVMWWYPR